MKPEQLIEGLKNLALANKAGDALFQVRRSPTTPGYHRCHWVGSEDVTVEDVLDLVKWCEQRKDVPNAFLKNL